MIENCCNILFEALDGRYGWQDEVLTIVGIVVIFNFFARWLLAKLHKRFERQKKLWQASFVQALYAPLIFYTWFFAIVHASNLILPQLVSEDFFKYMHMLLAIVAVLSVAWFIMRWKKQLLRLLSLKVKRHELAVEQAKLDVIDKLITIVVIFMTILMLLEVSGRSMSTLIAFGGVGGLAIAFASQEMISNYFSGVMLYSTRPFTVGDWVKLPERDIEGHVEEIGWYMTRIRTFEKRPIYVPNALFSKMVVLTPSRMSHRQFQEVFSLRYQDLPVVKDVVRDIDSMLRSHPDVDKDQRILVYLQSLGKVGIEIEVTAYSTTTVTEEFAPIKQDLLLKIVDIIKARNADFANPVSEILFPDGILMKKDA